jgi:hypothetical protein
MKAPCADVSVADQGSEMKLRGVFTRSAGDRSGGWNSIAKVRHVLPDISHSSLFSSINDVTESL